jgi:hypothetical protein
MAQARRSKVGRHDTGGAAAAQGERRGRPLGGAPAGLRGGPGWAGSAACWAGLTALALACGGEPVGDRGDAAAAAATDGGGGFAAIADAAGCPTWTGDVGLDGALPPAALAGACALQGDLVLSGEPGRPLPAEALAPLLNLRRISGSLFLQGQLPADLSALARLEEVGGDLALLGHPTLADLSALAALRRVGHDLVLRDNASLARPGLPALEEVGGGVAVERNDSLIDLAGLERLTALAGSLLLVDNRALTSLAALAKLRGVGGDGLRLAGNTRLTSLDGLGALEDAGPLLAIEDNRDLAAITGLGELRRAMVVRLRGGEALGKIDTFPRLHEVTRVEIAELPALLSVQGFSTVQQLDALVVHDNPKLAKLTAFGKLAQATELRLRDHASLTQLKFTALVRVGTLELRRHAVLGNLSAFFTTKYVDVLQLCDNALLGPDKVETFLKQLYQAPIEIDGCDQG